MRCGARRSASRLAISIRVLLDMPRLRRSGGSTGQRSIGGRDPRIGNLEDTVLCPLRTHSRTKSNANLMGSLYERPCRRPSKFPRLDPDAGNSPHQFIGGRAANEPL